MPFWRSVTERTTQGKGELNDRSPRGYGEDSGEGQKFQEVRSACCKLPAAERAWVQPVSFSGYEQNRFFYNTGAAYEEIGGAAGLGRLEDGRALVRADFDRDGDEDLLLWNYRTQTILLLRNEVGQRSGFVGIRLRGKGPNTHGIGAVVRVTAGGSTQSRLIACGEGYLSCHPPEALVGVGGAGAAAVEVHWPSGAVQKFGASPTGAWYTAEEGKDALERLTFASPPPAAAREPGPAALTEGDPVPSALGSAGVYLFLASVEEFEEFEALKAGGGTLFMPPEDAEAAARAGRSAPGWTPRTDAPAGVLGTDALLPCVLVVRDGRVEAKFAGVGAGRRAGAWLLGARR